MNAAFDFKTLPRCGAHARSTGRPCQRAGTLRNGRCKLHGGRSTGAKTTEGLRKARRGNYQHGCCSRSARLKRQQIRLCLKLAKAEISFFNQEIGVRHYVPILAQDIERFGAGVEKIAALDEALEQEQRRWNE